MPGAGLCRAGRRKGAARGRLWADPITFEILRYDESLVGQVDLPGPPKPSAGSTRSFTLERADTTTTYEPVTFTDPDETMLLPSRVESVTVIRGSGVPRLRVTQQLANYRRFVTATRLVP